MLNLGSRSSLSAHSGSFERVERDCSFFTVGKIPTRAPAKIVPIGSAKYVPELLENIATVAGVICPQDVLGLIPQELGCAIHAKPLEACYFVLKELSAQPDYFWTSFPSRISATARIHPSAYVAPTDVVIGDDTEVRANATVLERTIIGARCLVGSGTTIGSDAYEVTRIEGKERLLPQTGGVLIGDDVVFLSNVTVARSAFPVLTTIGDHSSFDNLVHVAHDCVLGQGVKMTACSILCGRVTLEDGAYIGPNATVSNGVTVGRNATVTIGAVAVRDVEPATKVTGNFAMEHAAFMRRLAGR